MSLVKEAAEVLKYVMLCMLMLNKLTNAFYYYY